MGWRVSFYKADKNNPVIVKQEVDDGETYNDITINGEEIMYDQATDVWCELSHGNEDLHHIPNIQMYLSKQDFYVPQFVS